MELRRRQPAGPRLGDALHSTGSSRRSAGKGDLDFLERSFQQAAAELHLVGEPQGPRRAATSSRAASSGSTTSASSTAARRCRPAATSSRPTAPPGWRSSARTCSRSPSSSRSREPAVRRHGRQVRRALPLDRRPRWTTSATDAGMWDEEDGFFYDVLRLPDGHARRGSRCARWSGCCRSAPCTVFERRRRRAGTPRSRRACKASSTRRPELADAHPRPAPRRARTAAACRRSSTRRKLRRVLAPHARRERVPRAPTASARSRAYHLEHPYVFDVGGQEYRVDYLPGRVGHRHVRRQLQLARARSGCRSTCLIIRALLQYYAYYGDDFTVECPTGSGQPDDALRGRRRARAGCRSIFLRDANGRRPVYGGTAQVPERSALARPRPVLRVLPRRQRRGHRREPPDRLDRASWRGRMHLFATTTPAQVLELGKVAGVTETKQPGADRGGARRSR